MKELLLSKHNRRRNFSLYSDLSSNKNKTNFQQKWHEYYSEIASQNRNAFDPNPDFSTAKLNNLLSGKKYQILGMIRKEESRTQKLNFGEFLSANAINHKDESLSNSRKDEIYSSS